MPPDEGCCGDGATRPRITCAAAVTSGGEVRVWGEPSACGAPLERGAVRDVVAWLWARHAGGATVVTWGGASSDWRALLAALGEDDAAAAAACVAMAAAHVDVPLVAAATVGTMMSLASVAAGMGLGAKCRATSAAAPALWGSGAPAEQRAVLEHVQRDAQLTLDVYRAAMAAEPPAVQWLTRRGRLMVWRLPFVVGLGGVRRSLCVRECAALPPLRTRYAPPPPAFQVGRVTAWLWKLAS